MAKFIEGQSLDVQRATGVCMLATVLVVVALSLPPFALFAGRPLDLPSVHLLIELFSVVVSVMVATMAWYCLVFSSVP